MQHKLNIFEAFKSNRAKELYRTIAKYKGKEEATKCFARLSSEYEIEWDRIKDQSIKKLEGDKISKIRYGDKTKLYFWFIDTDTFYVTFSKKFSDSVSNFYFLSQISFAHLIVNAKLVFSVNIIQAREKANVFKKRQDRTLSREGALALKTTKEIYDENNAKWKKILSKRKWKSNDIDKYADKVMKIFKGFIDDYLKNPTSWLDGKPWVELPSGNRWEIYKLWNTTLTSYYEYIQAYEKYLLYFRLSKGYESNEDSDEYRLYLRKAEQNKLDAKRAMEQFKVKTNDYLKMKKVEN